MCAINLWSEYRNTGGLFTVNPWPPGEGRYSLRTGVHDAPFTVRPSGPAGWEYAGHYFPTLQQVKSLSKTLSTAQLPVDVNCRCYRALVLVR